MRSLIDMIKEIIASAGLNPITMALITLAAMVPPIFGLIMLIDSIRLMLSSRIVIKGKVRALPDYAYEVDGVTECETQGLIRSNIARTNNTSDQFEPDAFSRGKNDNEPHGSYNYDETDGIPAVDRPLFKPKKDQGDN